MNKLQAAHALISYYRQQFKRKFGYSPGLANRNKLKYLIGDALEDLSVDEFKTIIDFYLHIEAEPSLSSLCYEYDELFERMKRDEKDKTERQALLKETERRVQEFREKFGKHD